MGEESSLQRTTFGEHLKIHGKKTNDKFYLTEHLKKKKKLMTNKDFSNFDKIYENLDRVSP